MISILLSSIPRYPLFHGLYKKTYTSYLSLYALGWCRYISTRNDKCYISICSVIEITCSSWHVFTFSDRLTTLEFRSVRFRLWNSWIQTYVIECTKYDNIPWEKKIQCLKCYHETHFHMVYLYSLWDSSQLNVDWQKEVIVYYWQFLVEKQILHTV